MRCKHIISIFIIIAIIVSLGTSAMASSGEDNIIDVMKDESKESLVPYIELLGFNTTENSLSVSEEFLNNINRVMVMGLFGSCEHAYSSSSNGEIDILEWVSNKKVSNDAFSEYISFLNAFFGTTATLNSYDNLSDETYQWIDYENLCVAYCWLSEAKQICIRWYLKEDYVSSLKRETYHSNTTQHMSEDINDIAFDGIKHLQSHLLNPNSLILYEVYVNLEYGDSPAVFGYYGAQNRMGGISDDWFFVQNGNVQLESRYNKAVEEGDNQEIVAHGDLVFVKFKITSGSDDWIPCDIQKLTTLLN